MNNIVKPDYVSSTDWKILMEKYPGKMEQIIQKVENKYPIQYLIGDVDFYDCKIMVNESCLIPRFETEQFVEKVLNRLRQINFKINNLIDLGCGSGCISIAIAKNYATSVTAIDINELSLKIAKENALLNKVKINFIKEDMTKFDLEGYEVILSNPPYVREDEPVGEETKFEPQNALFAKENGLYFYKSILNQVKKMQKKPLLIGFEIGMEQGNEILNFIKEISMQCQASIEIDYAQKSRFVFITDILN